MAKLKRTADGTTDRRTKAGKEMHKRMAKARWAAGRKKRVIITLIILAVLAAGAGAAYYFEWIKF